MCSSNTRVWTEKLRKTYRVKLLKRRVIRSPLYETCRLSRAGSLLDTERDSRGGGTGLHLSSHVPPNRAVLRPQARPLTSLGSAARGTRQSHGRTRRSHDCPLPRPVDWPSGNLASSPDRPSQMTTHTPGHLLPGRLSILSPLCSCSTFTDPLTVTLCRLQSLVTGNSFGMRDTAYSLSFHLS